MGVNCQAPCEENYNARYDKPEMPTNSPFKFADPWAHRSDEMCCKTCMWFVRKVDRMDVPMSTNPVGRCRRHAPTMSGYPVVFASDWCGDHKLDGDK